MLRIYAADFKTLLQTLDRLMVALGHLHPQVVSALGAHAQDPEVHKGACEGLWESQAPLLDEAEKVCGRMELKDPVALINRIRERCSGKPYGILELQGSIRSLGDLIEA
jgi:hypothetical protein